MDTNFSSFFMILALRCSSPPSVLAGGGHPISSILHSPCSSRGGRVEPKPSPKCRDVLRRADVHLGQGWASPAWQLPPDEHRTNTPSAPLRPLGMRTPHATLQVAALRVLGCRSQFRILGGAQGWGSQPQQGYKREGGEEPGRQIEGTGR